MGRFSNSIADHFESGIFPGVCGYSRKGDPALCHERHEDHPTRYSLRYYRSYGDQPSGIYTGPFRYGAFP